MITQKEVILPHEYTPREYQKPLFNAIAKGYKRGVAIWHRRAGKGKTLINIIAKESAKRKGAYYYYFPTSVEGRKILWEGMDRDGYKFMDHFPQEYVAKKLDSQMKLDLINGSIFRIVGSDTLRVVGPNPVGCVFSEFAIQDPRAWDYVRPILAENEGWALFNYTPRGHNHGYDLWLMAQKNPKWFSQLLTVKDTQALSDFAINEERRAGMSEDLIQQEFYCSFEASVIGAYFGEQLQLARKEGRIGPVPFQDGVAVDTYWDLGIDDSMTIWLAQNVSAEVHFIDYYENTGEGLAHYSKLLQDKSDQFGWTYGQHTAPHDIMVRELGTGKSRLETSKELGINFVVAPRVAKKEDSIEAARNMLRICWFDDTNCKRGISALANYQKSYDELRKVFSTHPLHNWASHGADAFQTFAMMRPKTQAMAGAIPREVVQPDYAY